MSIILGQVKHVAKDFKAGNISHNIEDWKKITSDKWLLNIVRYGYDIEFETQPVFIKNNCTKIQNCHFNSAEENVISNEIEKLLNSKVLKIVEDSEEQFLSSIFTVPKRDGSHRLILNLKHLNDCVEKHHFKMETLKTALTLIKPNVFFASIDLKQAYYSVPISRDSKKYLRFRWQGKTYEYSCLPNGLSTAPRIFTKLLKPMYASLRKLGHTNVAYIDDSLLQSDTREQCIKNIQDTILLVDDLGFTIHQEKSVVIPTQQITFVGFILCSVTMTVRLTPEKVQEHIALCKDILASRLITIRTFAKLIGKCVASEPGVQYAALYYKSLEIERDLALKSSKGNFDDKLSLTDSSRNCVQWWIDNLENAYRSIVIPRSNRRIESDSSGSGWGCHDVTHNVKMHGQWSDSEKLLHINYLELKAAFLALKYLCSSARNEHIQLYLDNTTAIKYISKMGGRKPQLNELAKDIWLWCIERSILISCFHIPGKLNTTADRLSRTLHSDMEWKLDNQVFENICDKFGRFDIDLFASRENKKCSRYASFTPEREAYAINAFSLCWNEYYPYIFCPFSVLGPVLQKIGQEEAEAVIIAPFFATQPWFPRLLSLVCAQSFILPPAHQILSLNRKNDQHPLKKMTLGVFRVSGKPLSVQVYQRGLQQLSCRHGETPLRNNTGHISKSGVHFVVGNRLINFAHL